MAPHVGHSGVAIFSPSGHLQLADVARQPPLLPHANRTTVRAPIAKSEHGATGLPATVISSAAAIALKGGRANAARPPSHLARREARKAVQQLQSGKDHAKVSRPTLVGAVLQLTARAFTAVGLIMQRMASDDDTMVVLWRVGLCTYIATALPDMLSYLLAPQAILTVLSLVEPLLVSVLAAVLLPRDVALLTSQHSLATLLCVAGTLGCVLFAPGSGSAFSGATAPSPWITSKGILDQAPNGSDWLFQAAGARRLKVYLIIATPVLMYLVRQAYQHKRKMNLGVCSQTSCLKLPFIAAGSLALGRLTLGILAESVRVAHWQFGLVMRSPTVWCSGVVAAVCLLSCAYHVCQGVLETPPHIFVPLYCTMASLVQLFQSMVIVREFRDEPTEKILLTLACASVSTIGIVHLWLPGQKASKSGGGKASALPSSRQHALNCLEPILLHDGLPRHT